MKNLSILFVILGFSFSVCNVVGSHSKPRENKFLSKATMGVPIQIYDDENPLKLFKNSPETFKSYIKVDNEWRLDVFDSLSYRDNGKFIMRKGVLENDSTVYVYNENGNLKEFIVFDDGKTIDFKQEYSYDSILENYVTKVVEYGYEDGVQSNRHEYGKLIIRDEKNKIIEIKTYTIDNKNVTHNYGSFIPIYKDDTAVKCYSINFAEKKADTMFYTDIKWYSWTGQITEDDIKNGSGSFNTMSSLRNKYSFIKSRRQNDTIEYVREVEFSSDFIMYKSEIDLEIGKILYIMSWEKLDDNGSFIGKFMSVFINGSDTICEDCFAEEYVFDEQENIIKYEEREKENYNSDYELTNYNEIINTYDAQNRLVSYTILQSDDNHSLLDSVEKGILVYNNVSNEKQGEPKVRIYPNPVRESLYFSAKGSFDEIRIYNSTGKKVYSDIINNSDNIGEEFGNSSGYCNVSFLPTGIYIIELLGKKGVATSKFIK